MLWSLLSMSKGYSYCSLAGSRDSKMQGTEAISWHGKSCGIWHWKHENSEGEDLKGWNWKTSFSWEDMKWGTFFQSSVNARFSSQTSLVKMHALSCQEYTWKCSIENYDTLCVCVCSCAVHTKSLSHVWLFATLWTVAHQATLSMGILQAGILQWVSMPSSMGSSTPRFPALQANSSLSHQKSPRILEWVAYPFSRRSSPPRNWIGVSCIAGGFFTSWATREAHIYIYIYFFFSLSCIDGNRMQQHLSEFLCLQATSLK